jgi:hypothetical protein
MERGPLSRARPPRHAAPLAWAATAALLFVGNALFHGVVARELLDRELAGVVTPFRELRDPLYPLGLAACHGAAIVWLLLRGARGLGDGAAVGGAISLLVYGSWNVINLEVLPRWSVGVAAWDSGFHLLHGALAGAAGAWAYARATRRA